MSKIIQDDREYRFNYDEYNELTSNKYEYNNYNWQDQLTKFNDNVITYDEIGNPLTIGEDITLNWINGRQLNSYKDSNNTILINIIKKE